MTERRQEIGAEKFTWLDAYTLVVLVVFIAAVLFIGLFAIENKIDGLTHVFVRIIVSSLWAFVILGVLQIFTGAFSGDSWEETQKKKFFAPVFMTLALSFLVATDWDRLRMPWGMDVDTELAEVENSNDLGSLVLKYRPISNLWDNPGLALLKFIDQKSIDVQSSALRSNAPIRNRVLELTKQRKDWPSFSESSLNNLKSALGRSENDVSSKIIAAEKMGSKKNELIALQKEYEEQGATNEQKEAVSWFMSEEFKQQFDKPWRQEKSRLTEILKNEVSDSKLRPLILEGLESRFRSTTENALNLEHRAISSALYLVDLLIKEHGNYRVEPGGDVNFNRGGVQSKYSAATGGLNIEVSQMRELGPRLARPSWLKRPLSSD